MYLCNALGPPRGEGRQTIPATKNGKVCLEEKL